MRIHGNARTCPHSRLLAVRRVVEQGWTLAQAAKAAGVSVRTVSKWVHRWREEGEQGLVDRSSAPRSVPLRTDERRVALIAALRRLRMTGAEIAETLAMPLSTVSGILTRTGLGQLSRLEPPEPEPLREAAAGRARPRRRQEAGQDRPARSPRQRRSPYQGPRRRLGVRPRRDRRRDPHPRRRGARRREGADGGRFPSPCRRPLPQLRDPGRAGDDRRMKVKWRRARSFAIVSCGCG